MRLEISKFLFGISQSITQHAEALKRVLIVRLRMAVGKEMALGPKRFILATDSGS